MSKYGTDDRGWPLVPCDPKAIPTGYEPVRVGWAKGDEWTARSGNNQTYACFFQGGTDISCHSPFLIVRPIKPPIELPTSIVPFEWWVCRDMDGPVHVLKHEPVTEIDRWVKKDINRWSSAWKLPPWIAAQLPKEWHDLPWDQSAVQQTEGGGG